MLHIYCPELGEKEPMRTVTKKYGHLTSINKAPIEITASIGHYGGWYINTEMELKGRGIRKIDDNTYKLTVRAFEILKSQYDIKMVEYLD